MAEAEEQPTQQEQPKGNKMDAFKKGWEATKAFGKKAKDVTVDATKKAVEKTKDRLTLEKMLKQARESLELHLAPPKIDPKKNEKPENEELKPENQKKDNNKSFVTQAKMTDSDMRRSLFKDCEGIALITTFAVGIGFVGGEGGSGIVIAKTPQNTWSPPIGVGCGGLSGGALVGASKTELLVVLNTKEAVKTFMGKGQLELKAGAQVAAGTVGRDAGASVGITTEAVAPVVTYSRSKGAFAGVKLTAGIMTIRNDCNAKFYGEKVDVKDIASGKVGMPQENGDYNKILQLINEHSLNQASHPGINVQPGAHSNNNDDEQQNFASVGSTESPGPPI